MNADRHACRDERREERARQCARCNGIDYVEVERRTSRRCTCIFLGKAPPNARHGERPHRAAAAASATSASPTCASIARTIRRSTTASRSTVDKPATSRPTRLRLVEARRRRRPDRRAVRRLRSALRLGRLLLQGRAARATSIASRRRAARRQSCPAPDIDYLAKDYASFRQLMLDRLALMMPDWQRTPRPRPRHHAGRAAGLRRRPSQLLPGRGRDRGLPRHGAAADLGAPPRAAGRLRHARGLQRARLGNAREQQATFPSLPGRLSSCTAFPGAPESRVIKLAGRSQGSRREASSSSSRSSPTPTRPSPSSPLIARSGSTPGAMRMLPAAGRDRCDARRPIGKSIDGEAQQDGACRRAARDHARPAPQWATS